MKQGFCISVVIVARFAFLNYLKTALENTVKDSSIFPKDL